MHFVFNKGFAQAWKVLEGFLEKSLKIKYALKSTGKTLKCLEKSFLLDFTLLIDF